MTRRVAALVCALGLVACATGPQGASRGAPPGPGPAAAAPMPLTGSRWVGVVDGNTDPRMLPRLELSANGRLAGYTGCNMMSGTWSEEAGEARFGPIAATKRYCMGAEGDYEKRVLAAFAPGSRGVRKGDRFVITAPSGERFEFSPAAAS